MSILIAVLILGVVIIVHEFGHFILAKTNGIVVEEFSVGMGPRLLSVVKGGTRYSLKLIPFGGSCMMRGRTEKIRKREALTADLYGEEFLLLLPGLCLILCLLFLER